MAIETLPIRDVNGTIRNIAFSENAGVYTPANVVINESGDSAASILDGAMAVYLKDVHTNLINIPLYQVGGGSTTLSSATVIGDTTLTVASAAGFAAGEKIAIDSFSFATITGISSNVLTLDRQVDTAWSIGVAVEEASIQMNVNGSLGSPQIFKIAPPPGLMVHLTRIIFTMTHSAEGDLAKFGGITALTNGIQSRRIVNGVITNAGNWKTNGELMLSMYDVDFPTKAGGAGVYGTAGRYTFSKLGAALNLDGDNNDEWQLLIQDDLTGLDTFALSAQGHIV